VRRGEEGLKVSRSPVGEGKWGRGSVALTVVDLADLNDLDRAALGPPLGSVSNEQVIVQVGCALDVLPPHYSNTVRHVGDEDLDVGAGEACGKD
jgi:hypothetical protein